MNTDAALFFSRGDNGFMDMDTPHSLAAELGQEGGVDVEDPPPETRECFGAKLLHISGEDNDVYSMAQEGVENGLVERSRLGMGFSAQVVVGDTFGFCLVRWRLSRCCC